MLDEIFVFDNAIHCYDMSDGEPARRPRRRSLLARPAARDGRRRALGRLQRRLDRVRAPVDDRGAVRDGLRRRAHRHGDGAGRAALRLVQGQLGARPDPARDGEALPGSGPVLRRRRPALPGRRRRARAARLADQGARRALDQVLQRSRRRAPGAATTASSPTRCTSAAWSSASTCSSSTRASRSG